MTEYKYDTNRYTDRNHAKASAQVARHRESQLVMMEILLKYKYKNYEI